MIYLDNAATTFPKPEAVYQMVDYVQRNLSVNTGRGTYHTAGEAMQLVDETRCLMGKLVQIGNPNNIIFTPSATIAANEVVYGLEWDEYKTVYITPFEHNAIARPLDFIRRKYGVQIKQLPFDKVTHRFDAERAQTLFSNNPPDYVFINHVSNVTGTIIPIQEITAITKNYDALTIVDGSQSVGLIDIDLQRDGIDYLIFAGHKNLYSSWGVGGFVCGRDPMLFPILSGGTGADSLNLSMGNIAPTCYEPASQNIIAIASLNSSLKWLDKITIQAIAEKKRQLIISLTQGLKGNGCKIYLPADNVGHTSVVSFNIDGYAPAEVGSILSQDFDIAVRTGYHCAPYIHDFLGTTAMGGTIRVSVSYFNEESDIESLIRAIGDL